MYVGTFLPIRLPSWKSNFYNTFRPSPLCSRTRPHVLTHKAATISHAFFFSKSRCYSQPGLTTHVVRDGSSLILPPHSCPKPTKTSGMADNTGREQTMTTQFTWVRVTTGHVAFEKVVMATVPEMNCESIEDPK